MSRVMWPIAALACLAFACGSSSESSSGSGGSAANGGRTANAGGSGNNAGSGTGGRASGGSGGTAGKAAGGSGGSGDDCAKLAQCCLTVTSQNTTCNYVASTQSASTCGLALITYQGECPEVANPEDYGTTSDGWKYYPAWTNQSSFGSRQRFGAPRTMFATHTGALIAGTEYGSIGRSTDRGKLWLGIGTPGAQNISSQLAVLGESPDGTLFGIKDQKLVRSSNDGQQFEEVWKEGDPKVFLLFVSGTELYALTETGIRVSHDKGDTFELVAASIAKYGDQLRVDRQGSIFLFVLGKVYRKRGGSELWSERTLGKTTSDALLLADGTMLAATDVGVLRSLDYGDSWQAASGITQANRLFTTSQGAVVAQAQGTTYVSTDAGASFREFGPKRSSSRNLYSSALLPDDVMLVAPYESPAHIYASAPLTEAGKNPTTPPERAATCFDGKLNGDETALDCGGSCGACDDWIRLPTADRGLELISESGVLYAIDETQLWRSPDGLNWTAMGPKRDLIASSGDSIFALDGDTNAILVSKDGGKNFTQFAAPLQSAVNAFLVSPERKLSFMASAANLYTLADGSSTWSNPSPLPANGFASELVETTKHEIYVRVYGATSSVYRANADLSAWTAVSADSTVDRLFVVGDAIYAPTQSGLYVIEGDTATLLPDTAGAQSPVVVNSKGLVFFRTDAGFVSYAQGVTSVRLKGEYTGAARLLSDDRVLLWPYLSRSTTNW